MIWIPVLCLMTSSVNFKINIFNKHSIYVYTHIYTLSIFTCETNDMCPSYSIIYNIYYMSQNNNQNVMVINFKIVAILIDFYI